MKEKNIFPILYLLYPALLYPLLLLPYMGYAFLYGISILGIVLFFIYRPCNSDFLIGGAYIMPFASIPHVIISNMTKYGIDGAFAKIEWAPINIGYWLLLYTLPYILIFFIINTIINKIHKKRLSFE